MFDGKFRAPVDKAVKPVGAALRKTGLTPDHLTVLGLLVGVGAAFAIGAGYLRLGLVLVILAALPDLLDGALAKASDTASQRGAFFDSTVDRLTDALLLGGIAWYFASEESPHMSLLPFAVMAVSSIISYRARQSGIARHRSEGRPDGACRAHHCDLSRPAVPGAADPDPVDHVGAHLDHGDPTLRQGLDPSCSGSRHRCEDRDAPLAPSEPPRGANRTPPHTGSSSTDLTIRTAMADRARFPDAFVGPRRLLDAATTSSYRMGAFAARRLPAVVAAGLVTPAGLGANLTSPERRAMIERHLRRVDPTLRGLRMRRAVQEAFDSYARYWLESFRLPNLSVDTVERGFEVEGYEHIVAALDQGNGVILVLPHLGGWEWAGRWIVDQGHQITVVVEKIDPPELFDWFVDLRSALGMQVVALGPDAGQTVMRALRDNHVVCLLADRDLQGGGPEVEFFGERTTMPGGPATLSLRTGAPILPTGVYFTDRVDGHAAWVRPPLPVERVEKRLRADVQRITQLLAQELEILIRRAPSQWHMFQPNWPSDPGYGHPPGVQG